MRYYRSPQWAGKPPLGCEYAVPLSNDVVQAWELRSAAHTASLEAYKQKYQNYQLDPNRVYYKGQLDHKTWRAEPDFEWYPAMRYKHYWDLTHEPFVRETWDRWYVAAYFLLKEGTHASLFTAAAMQRPDEIFEREWEFPSGYSPPATWLEGVPDDIRRLRKKQDQQANKRSRSRRQGRTATTSPSAEQSESEGQSSCGDTDRAKAPRRKGKGQEKGQ